MFPLSNKSGYFLGGEIDELDAEEGGVDKKVAALVVDQVIELHGPNAGQLLLYRHLLSKLHGRKHLLDLKPGLELLCTGTVPIYSRGFHCLEPD
jgi:hypothetical protein